MEVPNAGNGADLTLAEIARNDAKVLRGKRRLQSVARWLRCPFIADSEGGTLVETAVTLPVVMLIMTGVFSFSIALYQKLQLAEAVTAGGRILAADRGDANPCQTVSTAIHAAAAGLTSSSITLTYTLNGTSQGSGTTSCPGPGSPATANTYMVAGGAAQIFASYPCTLMVYGSKLTSCTLQTEIIEVVQ